MPVINLSPEMFTKDLFLEILGCNRCNRYMDLVKLLKGFYRSQRHMSPVPTGNKTLIPALFFAIYRLRMGKLAHHLLEVLGFDYIPTQILNKPNYGKFRRYIRQLIRSDLCWKDLFATRQYQYQ